MRPTYLGRLLQNSSGSAFRFLYRSSTRIPATSSPPRRRSKTEAERAINKLVLISIVGRAYDTLTGALAEIRLLRSSVIPNARSASETMLSGYTQGRFTLLELLDIRGSLLQALLREQEALQNFHIAIATIEGLVGNPFTLIRESSKR